MVVYFNDRFIIVVKASRGRGLGDGDRITAFYRKTNQGDWKVVVSLSTEVYRRNVAVGPGHENCCLVELRIITGHSKFELPEGVELNIDQGNASRRAYSFRCDSTHVEYFQSLEFGLQD